MTGSWSGAEAVGISFDVLDHGVGACLNVRRRDPVGQQCLAALRG